MEDRAKISMNVWPRWMSKQVASLYTCYSEKQIERFIADGSLPCCKVKMKGQKKGCQIRIDKMDLDNLMDKSKIFSSKSRKEVLKKVI